MSDPAIVRVYTPADPAVVRVLVPGQPGPPGRPDPQEMGFDVILLAGQSNMAGRGLYNALYDVADARVWQFGCTEANEPYYQTIFSGADPLNMTEGVETGKIGPGTAFARAYETITPSNRRVLLVPCAVGGTSLINGPWGVGGELYLNAIAQANAAIATAKSFFPTSAFKGIYWVQGESDHNAAQSAYATALQNTIAGFRANIEGAEDSWFIIGQMVPDYIATTNGNVNAAQIAAPTTIYNCGFYYAPAGPEWQNGDNLHFNAPAQRLNGARASQQVQAASSAGQQSSPVAPIFVSAAELAFTSILLEWSAPLCHYTDFVVRYKAHAAAQWTIAPHPTPGARRQSITGLTPEGAYDFQVATVNGFGVSAFSDALAVQLPSIPAAPGQVTGLVTTSTTSSTVGLSWSAPSTGGAPSNYIIEYRLTGDTLWTVFPHTPSTQTSGFVSGLNPSTSYDFRVTAENGGGVGAPSAAVTQSTYPIPSDGILNLIAQPAWAAYSCARRLDKNYVGPALRIRRTSDNTSIEIGFAFDGTLDTAALLAFVGASDGYVTKLFDQSGSARDVEQSNSARWFRLVIAGVLQTFPGGSIPSVLNDATGNLLGPADSAPSGDYTALIVGYASSSPVNARTLIGNGGDWGIQVRATDAYSYVQNSVIAVAANGTFSALAPHQVSTIYNNTTKAEVGRVDQVQVQSRTATGVIAGVLAYGNLTTSIRPFLGYQPEVVIFAAALGPSDLGIGEANQRAYYNTL